MDSFGLRPGDILASKYRVIAQLGAGWEGEVYKIAELRTGIERAAKLFFPKRNVRGRTARRYARKLHRLRQCPILIQYHTDETLELDGTRVTMLVSEYVEGELLSHFLQHFPGRRLSPFPALHLLYALVEGIEAIHQMGEYHGDLHEENVIVNHFGLYFDIKLLDFFHWNSSKAETRRDDICDLIRLFYDCLGGAKHYRRQPDAVKYICCGLKRSLILQRFKTVSQLRKHIEMMSW